MADLKITQLPDAVLPLVGTELIEAVQGGVNVKAPASALGDRSNPASAQVFVDDFIWGSTETGEVGELGWSFVNGSVSQQPNNQVAAHPGVIRRVSGATAAQVAGLFPQNAGGVGIAAWSDFVRVIWVFNVPILAPTDVRIRIGALTTLISEATYAGAYLEKLTTDTNWQFVTRAPGGTELRTDSGVAVTANAWVKIAIRRVAANSYGFSINGGTEVIQGNSSNTPIEGSGIQPGVMLVPTTTTARNVDIDFCSLSLKALTR